MYFIHNYATPDPVLRASIVITMFRMQFMKNFVHLVLMDITLGKWTWGHLIIFFYHQQQAVHHHYCLLHKCTRGWLYSPFCSCCNLLVLNPPLSIATLLNVSNLKFCRRQLLRKTLLQLLPNDSLKINMLHYSRLWSRSPGRGSLSNSAAKLAALTVTGCCYSISMSCGFLILIFVVWASHVPILHT